MIETLPRHKMVRLPLTPEEPQWTARFLHLANQDPPGWLRYTFYAVKRDILHTLGKRVCPDHVQRIAKTCWTCGGSGRVLGSGCNRCAGSGLYSVRLVALERWRVPDIDVAEGYREYHVPTDRHVPRGTIWDIDGTVTHYRQPQTESSALWLIWHWRPVDFMSLCLNVGRHAESECELGDLARHLGWSRHHQQQRRSVHDDSSDVPF